MRAPVSRRDARKADRDLWEFYRGQAISDALNHRPLHNRKPKQTYPKQRLALHQGGASRAIGCEPTLIDSCRWPPGDAKGPGRSVCCSPERGGRACAKDAASIPRSRCGQPSVADVHSQTDDGSRSERHDQQLSSEWADANRQERLLPRSRRQRQDMIHLSSTARRLVPQRATRARALRR